VKKTRLLILATCLALGGVVQALAHDEYDVVFYQANVLTVTIEGRPESIPKYDGVELPALNVDENVSVGSGNVGLGGAQRSNTDEWLFGSLPVVKCKIACADISYYRSLFETAWRS